LPVGLKLKSKSPVKVVYDSHEVYTELSNNSYVKKTYFSRFERKAAGQVDAFITVNDSIADYLKKKNPELPEPVVVKNATKVVEQDIRYDGRLHEAAGLNSDKKILLYQGGYATHRGLLHLVHASVLLPDDWCTVFMGWGNLEETLREVARQIDPGGEKIRFVPPAPHKDLVLWSIGATLGVIPYENVSLNHYYCSPNKLWEYPIAGVPILASPFPELKSVIANNDIGWFFDDPVTPESIANVVKNLTDEEIQRAQNACDDFIRADNWSVYERKLISLYENISSL
jgi:glycosyltransferase involved in cell wall biosynthesis